MVIIHPKADMTVLPNFTVQYLSRYFSLDQSGGPAWPSLEPDSSMGKKFHLVVEFSVRKRIRSAVLK